MASRAMKLSPKKGRAIESETVQGNAVELLAYKLWQKRGSPIGSAEDDWFQAENELQARTGQLRSPPMFEQFDDTQKRAPVVVGVAASDVVAGAGVGVVVLVDGAIALP